MHALVLASLVVVGCGGAGYRNEPSPVDARPPCYPSECGGTGRHAIGASLVGIGVIVGLAALREIAKP